MTEVWQDFFLNSKIRLWWLREYATVSVISFLTTLGAGVA